VHDLNSHGRENFETSNATQVITNIACSKPSIITTILQFEQFIQHYKFTSYFLKIRISILFPDLRFSLLQNGVLLCCWVFHLLTTLTAAAEAMHHLTRYERTVVNNELKWFWHKTFLTYFQVDLLFRYWSEQPGKTTKNIHTLQSLTGQNLNRMPNASNGNVLFSTPLFCFSHSLMWNFGIVGPTLKKATSVFTH
jgi:hypothetical protein